jgi:hypothetical protein
MGKTKGPYNAEFAEGSRVRVVGRDVLERFMRDWRWHNPLQENQLQFAGSVAVVQAVSFYHGGDELYQLAGIPGVWHERCLVTAE